MKKKKSRKPPKQRALRVESEPTANSKQTHIVELSVSKNGKPYLSVTGPTSAIGTPLSRPIAAKMRKWLEKFFEVGCEAHGGEGCIECEKRCQWCGDDGEMFRRKGDRVCENCAYLQDQGEFD